MRMYDLIAKKRDKSKLNTDEINYMVTSFTTGETPDYQISAMLMAIYLNRMTDDELTDLTLAMAHSGDMVDLSSIDGIKVDKHSTGGVGDKTSLILTPIVAACGVKVAKMSGRGLGHTGGTVDKLEAITGYRTDLSQAEFFSIVNSVGASLIGQSQNIAPADKKLYALRDVTATVDCIPLIAASIMSKKLASGSDCILLDVKVGSGAFMKTIDDATALADKMVAIGNQAGRTTTALITDMDLPLGCTVGNAIEVVEAVEVLMGQGDAKLTEICIELATEMLVLAKKRDATHCRSLVTEAISSGSAFNKLIEMVKAHGGDTSLLRDTSKLFTPRYLHEVKAEQSGYITHINTEKVGISAVLLGAGRKLKGDAIDFQAGIRLFANVGSYVKAGDLVAKLYASDEKLFCEAESLFSTALTYGEDKPIESPIILGRVSK